MAREGHYELPDYPWEHPSESDYAAAAIPSMTIEEACESIMGERLFKAIRDDMGLHWAVVAAMVDEEGQRECDPEAITTIREWNGSPSRMESDDDL